MIKIEDLEHWNAKASALSQEGYYPWQYQYSSAEPEGFHVWFMSSGKKDIEIVTHSKRIQSAILNYKNNTAGASYF